VRGERLEVRLIQRGQFRLREDCRGGDKAVESRTASSACLVEKLSGQDCFGASKGNDPRLEDGLNAANLEGSYRAIEECGPGNGAGGEGLPSGEPTVNFRGFRRAFDQETNEVIGVQLDHAGR